MSTERVPLGAWITALVGGVAAAEPDAYQRLVAAVGSRRARITLDDETVVVAMSGGALTLLPPDTDLVDGEGATIRAVVLAILDGRLEVSDAVREGSIFARGDVDSVGRIFHAIEIILDVSARSPDLRAIAGRFQAEAAGAPRARTGPADRSAETDLLRQLGLLEDP
jgi:hypothetical protein